MPAPPNEPAEPLTREDAAFSRRMLHLAARHAWRAQGEVEPNPLVGCVIARGAEILGIGHHRRFGDLHAERDALRSCARQGHDPRGATAYVTLEPCCHTGKQPPCTEALIEAGIARVVCARPDPHEISAGGAGVLRDAGIECIFLRGVAEAEALAEPFLKRLDTRLPWVIAKWAQTLDGRVATRTGASQWISSERSRGRVHRLRAQVDAILTGMGTVIADDPMLTARGVRRLRRRALRVVVDPLLDIDPGRALIRTAREHPTVVACAKEMATAQIALEKRQRLEDAGVEIMGVPTSLEGRLDLRLLLEALHERRGVSSVLIEAGGGMLGSLFRAGLVDEAVVYVAPLVLGDEQARGVAVGHVAPQLADGTRMELRGLKRLGDDLELRYRRGGGQQAKGNGQ